MHSFTCKLDVTPQTWHSQYTIAGIVTSGTPSPILNTNIAMGYVKDGIHKAGTKLQVQIRKKNVNANVVKMPFVPSNYFN